jgi:hypothetical protein
MDTITKRIQQESPRAYQRTPVKPMTFRNLLENKAMISTVFRTKLQTSSQIRWSGLSSFPSIFRTKYALSASSIPILHKPEISFTRNSRMHHASCSASQFKKVWQSEVCLFVATINLPRPVRYNLISLQQIVNRQTS